MEISKKEILKVERAKAIGKNWFDTFVPKKNFSDTKKVFDKIMSGHLPEVEHHKNLVINTDGEERLISWHNAYIMDESKNIVGLVSSGEDITTQEKTEKELLQKTQTLERMNHLMVGRELKMIELKKELAKLKVGGDKDG